jgi:hypothetical protein
VWWSAAKAKAKAGWLAGFYIVFLRGGRRGSNPGWSRARLEQIPASHSRHSILLLCLSTFSAMESCRSGLAACG